jgi:AraC-like DNA-binding protein
MISRHSRLSLLPRHRHRDAYVALVLSGSYVEAGVGARVRAQPGTLLAHAPWEAHQNAFAGRDVEVLNLPVPAGTRIAIGQVDDVDEVARVAARDPVAAASLAVAGARAAQALSCSDWPDLLAADIAAGRVTSFKRWAAAHGLCPPSLSRGFRKAFGVSPKRYRYELQVARAAALLPDWPGSVADLAAASGFADQAHFSRGVTALTGTPPGRWRVKSVQA